MTEAVTEAVRERLKLSELHPLNRLEKQRVNKPGQEAVGRTARQILYILAFRSIVAERDIPVGEDDHARRQNRRTDATFRSLP